MRWILDVIAVGALAGLVFGVGVVWDARERERERIEAVASDVRRLELEVKYRAATQSAELNGRGWPVTIDPAWFADHPPRNVLLSGGRAWVEVATPDEAELRHPKVRMAVDDRAAAFWYNPYQGVVRARVPVMLSDGRALEVYNRINGSALASIFPEAMAAPARIDADGAGADDAAWRDGTSGADEGADAGAVAPADGDAAGAARPGE